MRSLDFTCQNSRSRARRSKLLQAGAATILLIACSSGTDPGATIQNGGASGVPGAAGSAAGDLGTPHAGATSAGGAAHAGNTGQTGGAQAVGGVSGGGGDISSAGATVAGSSAAVGGSSPTGGVGGAAGASMGGAGGSATGTTGPCDIYAAASTPCVAAHSTVRALYASYKGPLYQVRRASDKTTKDVPVLSAGSFVDVSVQDTFCSGTTCTISILYDQSSNKNDLVKSSVAHWLPNGGVEANAANAKVTVSGHTAHGIYVTANSNVAYRNNSTKGVAKADQPEAMYMVVDGKRYNDSCCFDYGNAETTGNDDGNGTMEAVYWGSDITWGGKGEGSGPWVAADLENGVFKGNKGGWQSQSLSTPSAKSVIAPYATAMGTPSASVDDAVQANIVAAGYGR
jgi:alpha-L-arabinofuranosidase B-like protein